MSHLVLCFNPPLSCGSINQNFRSKLLLFPCLKIVTFNPLCSGWASKGQWGWALLPTWPSRNPTREWASLQRLDPLTPLLLGHQETAQSYFFQFIKRLHASKALKIKCARQQYGLCVSLTQNPISSAHLSNVNSYPNPTVICQVPSNSSF